MASSKHPLDSIGPEPEPADLSEDSAVSNIEMVDLQGPERHPGSTPAPPRLSLDSIQAPALLVDNRLRIVWQNNQAIDTIWHRVSAINNGDRFPRLFDLLFDPQFHYHVENWRRWVGFFIQQSLCMISADTLRQQMERMTDRQKDVISTLMDRIGTSAQRLDNRYRLRQVLNDGRIATYGIVSTGFKEGRLTVLEPQRIEEGMGQRHRSYDIEERIENIRRHPNPVKRSFGMMAADLDNAVQLNMEMLSDEYSSLIHSISQRSIEIIERYGGIFNKHRDSGFFAYFLPLDDNEGSAMRTIECCLELRAEIAELSREWKVRKSWSHDIELNMGIHSAYEHVGILSAHAGEMVVNCGSALRMATNLSHWVSGGQIWATKSLFKLMPSDIYKQLRFGVMQPDAKRHQVFIHRCFSAITDLPGFEAGAFDAGGQLESVAVTQIFDRQV